jgi:hypothetical protein
MKLLTLLLATTTSVLVAWGQAPDVTYNVIALEHTAHKSSLRIKLKSNDTTFSNPSRPTEAKGTGRIYVEMGAIKFDFPYDYSVNPIYINDSSKQVVGGTIVLPSAIQVKGIVESGCDLSIPKGTFIDVMPTGSGGLYVEFVPKNSDKITLDLPIKISKSGTKSKAQAAISKLKIEGDGSFDINGDISFNASSGDSIPLGPVALTKCVLKYRWWRLAGQSGQFSVNVVSAEANIAVDGANSPLRVTVSNAQIDNDGTLSFQNATYAAPQTNAPSILFLSPLDFEYTPKSVQASMTKNVITSLSATGELKLPQRFSAMPTGPPQRVVFANVKLDYDDVDPSDPSKGRDLLVTVPAQTQDRTLYWDGFALSIPKATAGNNSFVLDLSSKRNPKVLKTVNGRTIPDDWKGLYIDSAKIDFPTNLKKQNQIPNIGIEKCSIDGEGFSGELSIEDPDGIPGLRVPYGNLDDSKVTSLSAKFYQNRISSFGAEGTLRIDEIGADLNVGFTVTSTGAVSILVDTSAPISLGGSPDIQVKFERGTVWLNGDGKHKISLSGAIHIADSPTQALLKPVAGASLSIDGLAFNEKMELSVDGVTLDLPVPYTREVGPVTLSLSQVGFSREYKQLNGGGSEAYLQFRFTGDVIVKDLPISGGISFDGLTVSKHGAELGGVEISVDIAGIGNFYVSMSNDTYQLKDLTNAVREEIPIYTGSGGFFLSALGPSGPGAAINFSCWKDGWYGEVNLAASPAIKLGSTGLEIRAGRIGLGHNVESSTGKFFGIPGPNGDYKLVPRNPYNDQPNAPPDWQKWIFVAGVRFADLNGDAIWGDLVLTAAWGNGVVIDISGKAAFTTPYDPAPNALTKPQDRLITLTLNYDSNLARFLLIATAEANIPSKQLVAQKKGIYLKGNLSLLISPSVWELKLGDDVNLSTSPPTFTNPVTAEFWLTQNARVTGQAALELQATFDSNKRIQTIGGEAGVRIQAALEFRSEWTWKKDWEVVGKASLDAYAGGSVKFSRSSSTSNLSLEYIYGTLGISVYVSFDVYRESKRVLGVGASVSGSLEVWYTRNADPSWGGTYSAGFSVKVMGVNLNLNASGSFGAQPKPL